MVTLRPNAAVGNGPPPGSDDDIDYDSLRFFNTFSWEFASHLYGGLGLYFDRQSDIHAADDEASDFETSPFVTYSNANAFSLTTQTSAGLGLVGYFDGFLGGDSRWQRLALDVRTYHKIALPRRAMGSMERWNSG